MTPVIGYAMNEPPRDAGGSEVTMVKKNEIEDPRRTRSRSNEAQQLEQALAQPDLDPTTEVAMRERHALSRPAKLWDLAVSAPYAETSTEDLRTQLEDAELEREELLPLMRAARQIAPTAPRSPARWSASSTTWRRAWLV